MKTILKLVALLALSAMSSCDGTEPDPAEGLSDSARPIDPQLAALQPAALLAAIPTTNIYIQDNLEIDDLDLLGSGDRDANLSKGANADNPNFPGPSAAAPATLGAEADYIDWKDLDASVHFTPFYDNDMLGQPDDIFSPDSCYNTGNSPSKANLTINGFAANDTWLYLMSERDTSNGQEEHHFYATQDPPESGDNGCADPTYLWDLHDGDIEITLRFQSTSGLPDADVTLRRWTGGDVNDLDARALVTATGWTSLPASATPPAYVALNVNGNDNKAAAGEDTETDLDGATYASGILAEVALDIDQVFGAGCGLRRTVSILSTAAGPGGRNDDIKDISGPYTIVTGTLEPSVTLYESCNEEFGYLIELALGEAGGATSIPLPDANIDVTLTYDCGGGKVTVNDPVQPDGTIAVPVDVEAKCDVNVHYVGSGPYDLCEADALASVAVYPLLTAQGVLEQSCDATYSWNTKVAGGSGDVDVEWVFDVKDGGVSSEATSTELSGTAVLASSGVTSASVDGSLTVTDSQSRNTAAGAEACEVTPVVQGILALRPLHVDVVPVSGDGTCPTDDVHEVDFKAVVQGGSGDWDYDWKIGGDAVLDAVCGALDGVDDLDQTRLDLCDFELGEGFCATGDIQLTVTDANPECAPDSDSIAATRVSSLDVTPNP